MRSRWLSGIEHAEVGMSGFPAFKKYKSKLSIDKLASTRAYVYMFDLLKGGPLSIILGFLSMIARGHQSCFSDYDNSYSSSSQTPKHARFLRVFTEAAHIAEFL